MEGNVSTIIVEQIYPVDNRIQQPANRHQNQLISVPSTPQNAISLADSLPHPPQQ